MNYLKGLLISVVVTLGSVSLAAMAESETTISTPSGKTSEQVSVGVNINTADSEALALALKGVGEKRAQAIVTYRNANGPFTDVNQLQEIKGISAAIIEKNLDKIRL